MEERRTPRSKSNAPRGNGRGKSSNFNNKRKNSSNTERRPFVERQQKQEQAELKFPLGESKGLCSFVVLNGYNITTVIRSLNIVKESVETVVVSVPSSDISISEVIQSINSDKIAIQKYTIENEVALHNRVFGEYASDIFIVTNSNVEPRSYALDILKKYLFQDSAVITVPTVYNQDSQILHYCLRFPKLISYIKILCGVKSEKERLVMMERGENGYYRIHRVDASKSQLIVVNSGALRSIGGKVSTYSDNSVHSLNFYKRIIKCGVTLFVPTARIIEHSKTTPKRSIVSWICYIMRNVF